MYTSASPYKSSVLFCVKWWYSIDLEIEQLSKAGRHARYLVQELHETYLLPNIVEQGRGGQAKD